MIHIRHPDTMKWFVCWLVIVFFKGISIFYTKISLIIMISNYGIYSCWNVTKSRFSMRSRSQVKARVGGGRKTSWLRCHPFRGHLQTLSNKLGSTKTGKSLGERPPLLRPSGMSLNYAIRMLTLPSTHVRRPRPTNRRRADRIVRSHTNGKPASNGFQ